MGDDLESTNVTNKSGVLRHPDAPQDYGTNFSTCLEELAAGGSQLRSFLGTTLGQRLYHPGCEVGDTHNQYGVGMEGGG